MSLSVKWLHPICSPQHTVGLNEQRAGRDSLTPTVHGTGSLAGVVDWDGDMVGYHSARLRLVDFNPFLLLPHGEDTSHELGDIHRFRLKKRSNFGEEGTSVGPL